MIDPPDPPQPPPPPPPTANAVRTYDARAPDQRFCVCERLLDLDHADDAVRDGDANARGLLQRWRRLQPRRRIHGRLSAPNHQVPAHDAAHGHRQLGAGKGACL